MTNEQVVEFFEYAKNHMTEDAIKHVARCLELGYAMTDWTESKFVDIAEQAMKTFVGEGADRVALIEYFDSIEPGYKPKEPLDSPTAVQLMAYDDLVRWLKGVPGVVVCGNRLVWVESSTKLKVGVGISFYGKDMTFF